MKQFSAVTVGEKIAGMGKRLRRLNRFQSLTLDEYLQDEDIQSIVERLLEQIIQSALDINRAFLKRTVGITSEGSRAPKNSETFILAGQYGLISPTLGQQMEKSGGLRNVLAHLYDEIEAEKVYEALQNALNDYPQENLEKFISRILMPQVEAIHPSVTFTSAIILAFLPVLGCDLSLMIQESLEVIRQMLQSQHGANGI